MNVKKTFTHENIEFRIVDIAVPYLNSKEPVTVRRVLAPNGKSLPYDFSTRETLKSIIETTTQKLDRFKAMGADILKECTE